MGGSKGTELEKYILGSELSGRDFFAISNGEGRFIDDPNTLQNASELIEEENFMLLDAQSYIYYIKYNNELYKFKVKLITSNEGETNITTDANYGVQKIKIDTENTRIGKKVFYDSQDENDYWIIIYDDNINGLQMVYSGVFGYSNDLGNGKFYLGSESFEDAVASYNGAIQTLNEACRSVVPTNNKIKNIRCVGSNPIIKDTEEDKKYYVSENLTELLGRAGYTDTDKMIETSDLNFESDFERMLTLENVIAKNGNNSYNYWLGSRMIFDADESECKIRPSCFEKKWKDGY